MATRTSSWKPARSLSKLSAPTALPNSPVTYAASAASSLVNRLLEKDDLARKRTIVEHINYAIDQLRAALDQDEGFADGWVMLAGVYGQKMTVRPLQAVTLGPKFSRAMSRAREVEPNNPRVVLMKATTDYNLPRIVGGNKERAVDDLQRTAGLFAEEVITDPIFASWGHDETYARLGIAYLDQGNLKAAGHHLSGHSRLTRSSDG